MKNNTKKLRVYNISIRIVCLIILFITHIDVDGKATEKPNIILIVADDLGYADLGCMGANDLSTPNLDKLAESGAILTNWYASSPICAPSRVGIMTGKYPIKAGMNVNVKNAKHNTGLPIETPTIAKALKKLGYKTSIFGKWHLGSREDYWPDKRGFDYWYGLRGGCVDFYSHILYYLEVVGVPPMHDLYENGNEVWENGRYFTDLITEKAVEYFNELSKNSDAPFFTFLSYTDPHYPMHAPEDLVEQFKDLSPERRIMAAKIKALDNGIGRVFDALQKNGQMDNTLIFFMSDNGPSREIHCWLNETVSPYRGGKTSIFRGHKMSLFEGGIRVPAIVSYPGHIPEGKTINEIGTGADLFPTFLTLAGGNLNEYQLDGKDAMGMFKGASSPHDVLFWEFRGQYAIRKGQFKLVVNGSDVDGVSSEDKIHLANLESSKGDQVNVKDQFPETVSELKSMADIWYENAKKNYATKWKEKNIDQRSYPPYIDTDNPRYPKEN